MKRFVSFILVLLICMSLCACGTGKTLNGTYVSESGETTISFRKDGTCTMTEGNIYCDGTYTKIDSGWQIELRVLGFIGVTYTAEKSGKYLVLSGNNYNERFTKK